MSRIRIIIRAFTCRRDAATAELLARVLRHYGCEVLVTSMRDFERTLRLWKPHVAVVNTPGHAKRVKSVAPHVATVWLDGEGFLPDEFAHAQTLSQNIELFRAADIVLLWGKAVRNQLCAALAGEDLAKVHVVGNPTYDLIRFRNVPIRSRNELRSVGMVMRFGTINNHFGIPPTRTLPNPGNLERVIVECQSFVSMIECIRWLLRNTDYKISLRPHPLEQIESYQDHKAHWLGRDLAERVSIDNTLSFSHWAIKQRAIISPTSTSQLEAYLLKVPVINVDVISGTDAFMQNYAGMTKIWQGSSVRPRNMDELADVLGPNLPEVGKNEALDNQLDEYCNYSAASGSACLAAASLIFELAKKTSAPRGLRLPTVIIDTIDELSFRRACRRNPLHQNMNYRRRHHHLPDDLDAIAENILRGEQSRVARAAAERPTPVSGKESIVDA